MTKYTIYKSIQVKIFGKLENSLLTSSLIFRKLNSVKPSDSYIIHFRQLASVLQKYEFNQSSYHHNMICIEDATFFFPTYSFLSFDNTIQFLVIYFSYCFQHSKTYLLFMIYDIWSTCQRAFKEFMQKHVKI